MLLFEHPSVFVKFYGLLRRLNEMRSGPLYDPCARSLAKSGAKSKICVHVCYFKYLLYTNAAVFVGSMFNLHE